MKPSDEKIYKMLDSKMTAQQIAEIIGWKTDSVRKSIHDLVKAKLVVRFDDGYISTYKKDEIQIKAHNPFNL
jgi:predicted transcriptional regulator